MPDSRGAAAAGAAPGLADEVSGLSFRIMTRAAHRALLLAMTSAVLLAAPACSTDVFDTNVKLATQTYQMDFGTATGTIPTVACGAGTPSVCDTQQRAAVTTTPGPSQVTVETGCDSATSRCFLQATARLTEQVDVLQDSNFVTKVERHSAWVVKSVTLTYTVPTNTLTFDVPSVDVYVGPPGTTSETDPGVAHVDTTMPIAAGTTFTDQPRQLTVAAGSAARNLIVSSVENKQTIVFLVVAKPRVEAGAPVPAGSLELDIYPTLVLGF
jgi:hypothetical protein